MVKVNNILKNTTFQTANKWVVHIVDCAPPLIEDGFYIKYLKVKTNAKLSLLRIVSEFSAQGLYIATS